MAWCADRATDADEYLASLRSPPIHEVLGEDLARAEAITRTSPAWMGKQGDVDLLFRLGRHLDATRTVETGVSLGWSALALLGSNDHIRVTSVDFPYPQADSERHVGACVPSRFRDRWTLVRGPDRTWLRRVLRGGPIDLAHYDSDKHYDGSMYAYRAIWNALRPGGVLVTDVAANNLAFADFVAAEGLSPVVLSPHEQHTYVALVVRDA